MECPRPLTNDEGEVRELTDRDFARFVPFSALPAGLQAVLSEPKTLAADVESVSARQLAAG
jgi:hypothetical protein